MDMINYFDFKKIVTIIFVRNFLLILFIIISSRKILELKFTKKAIGIIALEKQQSIISKFLWSLEIKYIEQTNIKKYIPCFDAKFFIAFILSIFILSGVFSYYVTNSIVLGSLFGVFLSSFPIIFLDFIRYNNYQKIRTDISRMLSILNRWYSIKEDLLVGFEKTSESNIGEPLKSYLKDFVVQIKKGLDISEGFYILEKKIDSPFFRTFILNINQAVKNRGDIKVLLLNLENESYRLEQEYNRRKIKTTNDRLIIYVVMISVFIVGYNLIFSNHSTREFYLNTVFGKTLIIIYFILYLIGFFVSMGITKLYY